MTYSIVARDPETGELGVGVQTHQPSVGAIVPWVKAGVGAVATQSFANIAFGPQALSLLESGLPADRALAAILAGDDAPAVRQVAVVDAAGRVAVHTGDACIPHAGHRTGEGYSVQANMMARDTVPDAMAEMFEATKGRLAVRIVAALEAAEVEGGDIRGRQSAALLVRAPGRDLDHRWDLRVDNDPEPLAKLRELMAIRLAGQALDLVTEGGAALSGDPAERLQLARSAFRRATELAPSDEQTFWFAVRTLGQLDELDEAVAVLEPLFARAPNWKELLLRLPMPDVAPLQERFR
ncbi:MAG: DUF1028 domain-containing protein [Hyphomicrobiales bacterium]